MYDVLINYIVKEECCDDHILAIRKLFDGLRKIQIEGVRITVFKLEHVFLHIVQYRSKETEAKLYASHPYQEFIDALEWRIQEPPIVNHITEVETYNHCT